VGRDLEGDTRKIARLKEAFPEVDLYADANESLTPKEAEAYLTAWKALGLRYVEEPLPIEEVEARRALRAKGILPLIADDSAMTPKDLRRELVLDTFDILNLKPARSGATWTLEMLSLAREKGKRAMVGSQAQSSFGAYQSALLAFQQGGHRAQRAGLPPEGGRGIPGLPRLPGGVALLGRPHRGPL
jgi:muconate cycloisomerase